MLQKWCTSHRRGSFICGPWRARIRKRSRFPARRRSGASAKSSFRRTVRKLRLRLRRPGADANVGRRRWNQEDQRRRHAEGHRLGPERHRVVRSGAKRHLEGVGQRPGCDAGRTSERGRGAHGPGSFPTTTTILFTVATGRGRDRWTRKNFYRVARDRRTVRISESPAAMRATFRPLRVIIFAVSDNFWAIRLIPSALNDGGRRGPGARGRRAGVRLVHRSRPVQHLRQRHAGLREEQRRRDASTDGHRHRRGPELEKRSHGN